jgi:poly(hydroxyalkanoate) granule-associated protein
MVKKFKAMADSPAADSQLASAIKDSAQQIWLAGLGAFAKAQDEGAKVFETLVKEGSSIQKRTKKMAESKVDDVTGKVSKVAGEISKQATEGWDKLEQVFEDRVARALNRLGVPTNKDIQALIARVDALNGNVSGMSAKPSKTARAAKAKATKVTVKAVKSVKAAAPKKPAKAVKTTVANVTKAVTKSVKAVSANTAKKVETATKPVVKAATKAKATAQKIVDQAQA